MRIYKEALPLFEDDLLIKSHAKTKDEFKNTILKIDVQNMTGPVIWYFFDDDCDESNLMEFGIYAVGTGWRIDPSTTDNYIGTVDYGYVYHYFIDG